MKQFILITITCLFLEASSAEEVQPIVPVQETIPDQSIQQSSPATAVVAENPTEPIEEITVTGQRIIFSLQKQIIQAEDRVLDIFNELNDDDLYDIHCQTERRIGSNIKQRVCVPNFFRKAEADTAAEYVGLVRGEISVASPSAQNVVNQHYPILREKMRELAKKSPEFVDALRENYDLRKELHVKRNAYHGVED